jgi:hypothetical protein
VRFSTRAAGRLRAFALLAAGALAFVAAAVSAEDGAGAARQAAAADLAGAWAVELGYHPAFANLQEKIRQQTRDCGSAAPAPPASACPPFLAGAGAELRIAFKPAAPGGAGLRFEARLPCNLYAGTLALAGGARALADVAGTRRACAPPLMALDEEFIARLRAAHSARLVGGKRRLGDGSVVDRSTLVLADRDGAALMLLSRRP